MSTDRASKCHHIRVPPEACRLLFSDDRIFHTDRLGTSTRGEEMWAHCDADGRIIEIELLGTDKPCQVDDSLTERRRPRVTPRLIDEGLQRCSRW
jgi:hypothetical protein